MGKGFFPKKEGYVAPRQDFRTTTTIWPVNELIRTANKNWRGWTEEDGKTGSRSGAMRKEETAYSGTYSIFPAPLMEYILVRYGGGKGNKILDPFAGGPPRGIVASLMGYEYHGVDVRQEAIDEDRAVCKKLGLDAHYYLGDACILDIPVTDFDVCISCPPYYNLEVYSDQPNDLSVCKTYNEFNTAMWQVANAHVGHMKPGAFICMVVGNFRDKKTAELIDFRGDTVHNFRDNGFLFWQDIVLSKSKGSAAVRAATSWKGKKLVPCHEYLLVFRTPK